MDAYYPDLIGVPNDGHFDILFNHLDLDDIAIHKDSMELEIPIKNSACKFIMSIKE